MAQIIPFKALRYNQDIVSGSDVTAPPYDVISEVEREMLYSKSPYNIIRIDFAKDEPYDKEDNKYKRASKLLHKWIKEQILVRDETPCFYHYEVNYKVEQRDYSLKGTFLLFKIEELGNGIYPHEHTHSKPKADRLNLMKHCLANISPIFAIYRGSEKSVLNKRGELIFEATDRDNFKHLLFKNTDTQFNKVLIDDLKDKPVFIADGHHRYEVALEFKRLADKGLIDELKEINGYRPWDYVLMYLVDVNNSDVTILPTHRLVRSIPGGNDILKKLDKHFDITRIKLDCPIDNIKTSLDTHKKNTFGLYMGNQDWFLLKYKGNALNQLHSVLREIDTVILQELILKEDLKTEDIYYEMDLKKAIDKIKGGDYKALFILNPTPVEEVERVAINSLRMPPKSTYFYPKLLTGMVINVFF